MHAEPPAGLTRSVAGGAPTGRLGDSGPFLAGPAPAARALNFQFPGRARLCRPELLPLCQCLGREARAYLGREARVPSCDHDGQVTGSARRHRDPAAALAVDFGSPPCLNYKWTIHLAPVPVDLNCSWNI